MLCKGKRIASLLVLPSTLWPMQSKQNWYLCEAIFNTDSPWNIQSVDWNKELSKILC